MSEQEEGMPERIWAGDFNGQGFGHCVAGMQGGLYEEYVLASALAAAEARAQAAEQKLADAVKVLEPFARYRTADGVKGMDGLTHLRIPDDHMLLGNMDNAGNLASVDPETVVTVGHFRAARRLIKDATT